MHWIRRRYKEKIGGKTKVLNVKDRTILLGFKDYHMHFSEFIKSISKIDLRDCASIEEIKEKLKEIYWRKNYYWSVLMLFLERMWLIW